ncbi:MAG: HAD family hydrolase [Tangfeifania sp.]
MQVTVIFDMDGVIVDNGEFHFLAWEKFCDKHNISISKDEFKSKFFGRTNEEVLPELFGCKLSGNEIKSLGEEKEKIYREIYKPHLQPVKGLVNFLEELKKENIAVGVATSAPPENVKFVIDGLKIGDCIQAVVDDSMVTNGKPAPDIYLEAARRLTSEPENCVVFEDSLSGTKSAFDAGAKVVALTTTLPAGKHKYAHRIIDDFESVSTQFIKNLFD